jgi:hypothetical protein
MSNHLLRVGLVLLVAMAGCAKAPKYACLVPSEQQPVHRYTPGDNNLAIHAWAKVITLFPGISTAYLRIACADSVFVDLSRPRVLTKQAWVIADFVNVWELDTVCHEVRQILNIAPYLAQESFRGRLTLGPGVYLAQVAVSLNSHEELRRTDSPPVFDLGEVVWGSDTLKLDSVSFALT